MTQQDWQHVQVIFAIDSACIIVGFILLLLTFLVVVINKKH